MTVLTELKEQLAHFDRYETDNLAIHDLYLILNILLFNDELPTDIYTYILPEENPREGETVFNGEPGGSLRILGIGAGKKALSDFKELCGILLHEMVHVYCLLHKIPDFDQETGEHLPGFIEEGRRRGLYYQDTWNRPHTEVISCVSVYAMDFDFISGIFGDFQKERNRDSIILDLQKRYEQEK